MPRHAVEWDGENVVDNNGDVKPASDFLDGDGQLHEAPDERLFDMEIDTRLIHESASAALRAMTPEAGHKHYPAAVEDVIAARQAKAARAMPVVERDDPMESLGGGLRSHREAQPNRDEILENVLGEFEPWHVDTRLAVERFGVVEFTRGEIANLPEDKFDEYSLHFYGFMQSVEASERQIDATEGHIEYDTYLKDRYPGRTQEEMLKYRETLKWLRRDLAETGIPEAVYRHLGVWNDGRAGQEVLSSNRRKALTKLTKFRHTHKLHNIQLVKNKDKLQVERIA